MFAYTWPGNVRELQNVLERAVLLCKGDVIEPEAIPQTTVVTSITGTEVNSSPTCESETSASSPQPKNASTGQEGIQEFRQLIVQVLRQSKANGISIDLLNELEGLIVRTALDVTRGNKQAAATLLGLYRPRLYSLLRKHNLHEMIRDVDAPASENGGSDGVSYNGKQSLMDEGGVAPVPDVPLAEGVWPERFSYTNRLNSLDS
jgi:DNA-binding NtrC family response regulator